MSTTVIVPTYNESPNVAELVRRLGAALPPDGSEILFVDDSSDDTPAAIRASAAWSEVPVRLIHRDAPVGGLSGAVVEGIRASAGDWCVVMDGDLQHPPELVPVLLETGAGTGADVVVASRHVGDGSNAGLSGVGRKVVSNASIALTRAMFPSRLRNCTDPMTGFFALRRAAIEIDTLRPQGFKILLEILARQRLRVVEEPFIFGARFAGESKADFRQGLRFVQQLAALRFGRMSRFGLIGAVGAVANLAIMAGLIAVGVDYLVAAVIAAVITIVGNFFLQEAFVFHDLRAEGRHLAHRFAQSVGFNALEALARLPLLYLIVQFTPIPSVLAQAVTLVVAFIVRYVYHARVVYRPRRTTPISPLLAGAKPVAAALERPSGSAAPAA
ncbi:MAG: glycosyl transferase family 2 [Microbacterium sp.]|uniref:glycosyltransferase n=1 Tax=Microbacterium sp. TaxID=51671 RepID=UPI000DB34AAE|nr:glycosyltransferase family 2 protein [Microbacterium sp.]PZU37253.1 MAG: glycosyl transferase family 2 [Microbacterium sp.]